MKASVVLFTFAAAVLASPNGPCDDCICASKDTVVCQEQGNGGLISLGNVSPGAVDENCASKDVYCCAKDDVNQSDLANLDVAAQCSLNRVL
ncbi:hypothetical protein ANOM_000393 [Aspergillus nomiae NRRL 13137]|uniref:Hydrophobin n=1 Tax=Aspergillus nomiae NRRL (strain ATCC 15546 / NRRL 13137 / CBS 260.88 / M93) TaxID=1509407 RepID=A0A0L1JHN9_ASPN3|nr:uncharacterized protein ANOM_000393 [Aspergillus nomiae NRRL 13137]KNG91217.1 hypothetical protein ANOM_000393 [Aspergillus nomiae NRRL 13137]